MTAISTRNRSFLLIIFISIFLVSQCVYLNTANAQSFGLPSATAPVLTINPQFPEPYANAKISLPTTVQAGDGSIRWYIDGVEQIESKNERSILIETGAPNESIKIEALVAHSNSPLERYTHTITPKILDIIIEPHTIVPVFYEGKPLPSQSSQVTIIALPESFPEQFTYKWSENNTVLFGGPVRGKYKIMLESPLSRDAIISVEVSDASGNIQSRKTFALASHKSELHFYEQNPLRGIQNIALRNGYNFAGSDLTVRAEPYYMDRETLYSNTNEYTWTLNNATVPNPDDDLHVLNLQSQPGGRASIEFEISNLEQFLQFVTGAITVNFTDT